MPIFSLLKGGGHGGGGFSDETSEEGVGECWLGLCESVEVSQGSGIGYGFG